MEKRISIHNISEISAIYFALLQCGYDYYAFEKDADLIKTIEDFRVAQFDRDISFFSEVKQKTCEVYPYWPRAAALETATFFFDRVSMQFKDFKTYQNNIMSASNISDVERNQDFWEWVKDFPSALACVLNSNDFQAYLSWEDKWIEQQNLIWEKDLGVIQRTLDICVRDYASPVQKVSIVLNPIKCAYSADYHMDGTQFFFCSGAFRTDSVIHEFLHHVVHHSVEESKDVVLQCRARYPDIDESYYLSNDEVGRINAFEEYMVRCLTKSVLANSFPSGLDLFIDEILRNFS